MKNLVTDEIKSLNENIEKKKRKRELREKKNEYIEIIRKETGWKKERVEEDLERAKQVGMPYYRYVNNACWNMGLEEIKLLNESIEKKKRRKALREKKNEYIETIIKETGWEEEKAREDIERAKQVGMPYYRYVNNACWNMGIDEIKALNESIEKKKRRRELRQKKNEYIETIIKETGWEEEKAKEDIERAKQVGMPYYRYVNNACWNMDIDEIKALNEKIERRIQENKLNKDRDKCLMIVINETGWDEDKAIEELEKAKCIGLSYSRYIKNKCWNDSEVFFAEVRAKSNNKKHIQTLAEMTNWKEEECSNKLAVAELIGISNKTYINKNLFELTDDELDEYAALLKENQNKNNSNRIFYRDIVCEKTGWSSEKAEIEMNRAQTKGVTYLKYIQKEFWKGNNERRDLLANFINADKKRIENNKTIFVDKICDITKWSKGKVELEILRSKVNCGCSYEDYYAFQFYNKSLDEQKQYVTLDLFNKMRIKYNNHLKSALNFDNKATFNKLFAEHIKHKWFLNEDLSFEEFKKNIEGLSKVIIKPLTATQGLGIEVLPCNQSEEENRKLYDHIIALDKCIVEEYIVQHEELMKYCNTSVNTIRVMTLNFNGECKFLYSVFRMGRNKVVDNFHAGGVAATIDMESGIVCSNAADLDGNVYTHSPATGEKIKGFKIPYWKEVVDMCKKITGKVEGTNLVGWDFAITEDGVDLIEGNPGASYIVAQIPNVEDNIGLANVMAIPYL